MTAALSVHGLTVRLPVAGRAQAVVDDIDIELAPGEIVGLVGESGCGKTLAAFALLGMVPPPAGSLEVRELRLAGRDLTGLDERSWRRLRGSEVAMVFQEPLSALDPVLTVGSQMSRVLRRHRGCGRDEADRLAGRLLSDVGLPHAATLLTRFPHELSGGMRQRVLVAMALSCGPRIIVADEPTTALDVTTQAQVLDLLRARVRADGMAVLLVTHDLTVVERVCDRALIMYAGRIVEEGDARALLTRPRHPYTAGLLAAMPRLAQDGLAEGEPVPVRPIPGQVPPPDRRPDGCRFHDRCARATAHCRTEAPVLQPPAGSAHRFACHHPLVGPDP